MKKALIIFFSILFLTSTAQAMRYQKGYFKPSSGTYVNAHAKTKADSSKFNNYSTNGQYNPTTGKRGYKNPYKSFKYPKRKIK
jgi:hypothetical protein